MIPRRFAVVLTHNRPQLVIECVAAIGPQVDVTIVIDNASTPPVELDSLPSSEDHNVALIRVPDQPPNLAVLWNKGIDLAAVIGLHTQGRRIAFLCDDALVPPGWFDAVTAAMTATGAPVGCSNPFGHEHEPRVKTAPDSDIAGRMPGWAWILNPESGIRADETMRWWWLDTDVDMQARAAGGMVMAGGFPVFNQRPNDFTNTVPGLAEQAGDDGRTFEAKWGYRPW
jgi:hypothetical protein